MAVVQKTNLFIINEHIKSQRSQKAGIGSFGMHKITLSMEWKFWKGTTSFWANGHGRFDLLKKMKLFFGSWAA